jgi:selenocysteine lyase/cysteine desulfurase
VVNQQLVASRTVPFPCDLIRSLFPALNQERDSSFLITPRGPIFRGLFSTRSMVICCIATVQRGGRYAKSMEVDATIARARESVGHLINARSPNEIAFGMNATSFLRLLRPGDRPYARSS